VENGKLEYDYSMFTSSLTNYLIPLEIIYRNGLPEGSSIFKRLAQGDLTFEELGLDHYPKPGEKLSKPIFDVSTKLEDADRYLTWTEAKRIAGLTDDEVLKTRSVLSRVNSVITKIAATAGFENEDGKIELAFDNERRLIVADVVGTLDECRFTYNGLHVSKEIARKFYQHTRWHSDVEEAKKVSVTKGVRDWRTICKSQPPKMDPKLRMVISEMYMAAANQLTNRKLFDISSLAEVAEKYRSICVN
jgi:phosphoribosylaminoimidazole-succinocarboxamide synthase